MVKIALFCSAGMSTSMLVAKMKAAAEKSGIEAHIEAFPEATIAQRLEEGIDVALLGPQIRFKLNQVKTLCEPKGVQVEVINSLDYGMMNGEKVLETALKLVG